MSSNLYQSCYFNHTKTLTENVASLTSRTTTDANNETNSAHGIEVTERQLPILLLELRKLTWKRITEAKTDLDLAWKKRSLLCRV